jgi:tetratricopeptide (TPR) repeat protein
MNYFNKSSKIFEEIGNEKAIVLIYINIGEVYLKQGKLKEAFFCATKSRAIAEKLGFPSEMGSSASLLKTIFIKQNKYKEAFEMYEVEIKMRDSINNQETQKATIKKQMQYTYEKKELETKAEQDKKDAVSKAELKQKENERNYFIVGFGLVAVLALFILRGYKQKQKANEIIAAQKDLVDEKQKEILDSIYYAKRIQTALLPSEKYIDKSLKQLNKKNT